MNGPIAPLIPQRAAAPVQMPVDHGAFPLASVPQLSGDVPVAYAMAKIDSSGRFAEQGLLRALGWSRGDALTITTPRCSAVKHRDRSGFWWRPGRRPRRGPALLSRLGLTPQSASRRATAAIREGLIAAPILIATLSAWWFQFEALRAAAQPALLAAMVATALESLGPSMAGLAHKARTAHDSPTLYRAGMWTIVLIAAAINYRHGSADWTQPGLNGIVFAALSLGSVTGWELRERQHHPDRLPPQRPRFGCARWTRFPSTTTRATSLAIRNGITDPNTAWLAALAELQQPHAQEQRHQQAIDLTPTAPVQPSARPESEPKPPPASTPPQAASSVDVSGLLPVAQQVAAELGQRLSRDRLLDGIRAHGHSAGGRRRAAIYDAVRTPSPTNQT